MNSNPKKLTPSAKHWEWGYLRNEFRNSGLEDCYKVYCERLLIPNISLVMLLEVILMVTHVILLWYTVENTRIVRTDFFVYLSTMLVNLFLLKTNYNTDLKRRRPNLILTFNLLVVFNMVFRDVFVVYYHHFTDNEYLACNYNFVVLIIIYLVLPLKGHLKPFLCAITTTVVYDIMNTYIRILHHDSAVLKSFVSVNIFNLGLHLMGLFDRLLNEYHSRIAVLTRTKFLEEKFLLKFVLAREKIMMHTILPADIASRLEQDVKQRIETGEITHNPSGILFIEPHDNVSIMSANITNFTRLTNGLSAKSLVKVLHDIFVKMDLAAAKHNVMPIKFMGDSYNCVAGIPYGNPRHAKCTVDLGLEMIDLLQEVCKTFNLVANLRIGVHSGDVLSGIIGTVKWQYDVWSKDVDIANRLERSGSPGYVHISEQTYQLLDDQYILEEGTQAALEDPILQKYHLVTYLVKKKQRYTEKNVQGMANTSPSAITLTPELLPTFGYNYKLYCEEARAKALLKMEDEVRNMSIGRIEVTRCFDFSDEPESSKWEDAQFKDKLSPLFLLFRQRSDELGFLKGPDKLVKYTVLIAAIIGFIIIIESAANTTFLRNLPYLIFLCSVIFLLCFVVIYKKLWLILISKSVDDRQKNWLSKLLYKLSNWIEHSLTARIVIFFCFIGGTFAMCSVQLINCGMKEFELLTVLAEIEDLKPPHCFESFVYTYSTVIVTMLLFLYPNIPLILKACSVFIILMTFLINVLGQYSIVFETSRSSNMGLPAEYAHCWFVVSAILVLYIIVRKRVFTRKLHFIVRKSLLQKHQQIEIATNSIRTMFNNILPVHVADRYYLNMHRHDIFSEEFTNVAVMFASIENFDADKTGIRMLNEIICLFDNLLSKYNGQIEKIKVDNWTYLAACGLSVYATEIQNEIESKTVYQGSALYRESKDYGFNPTSSVTSLFVKDNDDAVVLTMTQFAVDMLRIMHDIVETGLLLESMSESESGLTIGIANGRIKAGVVGQWRTHYDIWGESVNMAARMNSSGLLNQIQVTEETAQVLQGFNIRCNSRGLTFIRGFGAVNSYIVALDNNYNLMPNKYDGQNQNEMPTKISLKSVHSTESTSSKNLAAQPSKKEDRSGSSTSSTSESSKNK